MYLASRGFSLAMFFFKAWFPYDCPDHPSCFKKFRDDLDDPDVESEPCALLSAFSFDSEASRS